MFNIKKVAYPTITYNFNFCVMSYFKFEGDLSTKAIHRFRPCDFWNTYLVKFKKKIIKKIKSNRNPQYDLEVFSIGGN